MFIRCFLLIGCISIAAQPCNAAIESLFFPGETNQLSDNSGEFLISRSGGETILDVGDILVAMFTVETIEDLTGTGGSNNISVNGYEFTGVSVIQVATKTPAGGASYDFTFSPVKGDAAAEAALAAASAPIAAIVSSWADGTMIGSYVDTVMNYTRLGPGDETAVTLTAADGTPFIEFGYHPDGPVGTQTFWNALNAPEDISIFSTIPAGTGVGQFNFGLDVTANYSLLDLGLVSNFDLATLTPGTSQANGSGGLLGILDVDTPLDAFDNIDFVINVLGIVPEPLSGVTWLGLAFLGSSIVSPLRKRVA